MNTSHWYEYKTISIIRLFGLLIILGQSLFLAYITFSKHFEVPHVDSYSFEQYN